MSEKCWYVRSSEGSVYGPASLESLVEWAKEGRVEPTGHVSRDRRSWMPPQLLPELEMKWLVEVAPGKFFGPFNRALVIRLSREGQLPEKAGVYRLHELPVDRDPEPVVVEKIVEKVVEKEVRVEVPVAPPARTTVVVPEVVDASAAEPPLPRRFGTGVFKDADPASLAALESAARRELSAVKNHGFGGLFGGRR